MSFLVSFKQLYLMTALHWRYHLIVGGSLIVFVNILLLIISDNWTTRLILILLIILGILISYAGYRSLQKFKTKYDTYEIELGNGPHFRKKTSK